MGETQNESRLLVFLLPALLIPLGLAFGSGDGSAEWSFLIIAAPMVAFPIILIVGQVWNGHTFWKNTLKEGGIPALMTMTVTLGVGIFTTLFSVYFIARLFTALYVIKNKDKERLI